MISRRHLMAAAGGVALAAATRAYAGKATDFGGGTLEKAIAGLETESGGRLGVAVLDTGSGARFARRGDERFAMCSTFKFLLAAAILARVDQGRDSLDRRVPVTANDIVSHSPAVEPLVGRDATVAQLCEATMTLSDNAAANLLLPAVGGPQGLTRFLRSIGDKVTRLDRIEPALNDVAPGDPRDTTSPNAMLADLDRLLLGRILTPASRDRLIAWLVANRTGDTRLRAGLPAGWRVGDKTGTGDRGTSNDIAIIWPPAGSPLLVTSYLTASPLDSAARNMIHASVARAIAAAIPA